MNILKNNTLTVLSAAGLFAMLVVPAIGMAEDKQTVSIEVLAEQSATTAEQHQSLAAYYHQKAEDARAEVKKHRQMAVSFSSRSAGAEAGMKSHCDNLADAARKSAIEYDAMAAEHEAEAKKAAK